MKFLQILLPWQTSIVGIVGFFGVVVTLVLQNSNAVRLEDYKRTADALAIRIAIKSEISSASKNCSNINMLLENSKSDGAVVNLLSRDTVFLRLADKLGLLSATEVQAIYDAYIEQTRWTQIIQSVLQPLPNSPGSYILSNDQYAAIIDTCNGIISQSQNAVNQINAHIPSSLLSLPR